MGPETKEYFKVWGHYPFWDDPDPQGFNKRVRAEELRVGEILAKERINKYCV